MDIKEIKLSVSQIQKMKHAVGLDNPYRSKKKFGPHRNFYATSDDPEWNEVVEMGLAVKRGDPFCKDSYVYQLNPKGLEYLSRITGITMLLARSISQS